jgi:hypothetical protein
MLSVLVMIALGFHIAKELSLICRLILDEKSSEWLFLRPGVAEELLHFDEGVFVFVALGVQFLLFGRFYHRRREGLRCLVLAVFGLGFRAQAHQQARLLLLGFEGLLARGFGDQGPRVDLLDRALDFDQLAELNLEFAQAQAPLLLVLALWVLLGVGVVLPFADLQAFHGSQFREAFAAVADGRL